MANKTLIIYSDGDRDKPICKWLTEDGVVTGTLNTCEIRKFCKTVGINKATFVEGGKPAREYRVVGGYDPVSKIAAIASILLSRSLP